MIEREGWKSGRPSILLAAPYCDQLATNDCFPSFPFQPLRAANSQLIHAHPEKSGHYQGAYPDIEPDMIGALMPSSWLQDGGGPEHFCQFFIYIFLAFRFQI